MNKNLENLNIQQGQLQKQVENITQILENLVKKIAPDSTNYSFNWFFVFVWCQTLFLFFILTMVLYIVYRDYSNSRKNQTIISILNNLR